MSNANWCLLRGADGGEVLIDASLVIGVWPIGFDTRVWTFAKGGTIDLKGSPREVADQLDFELPSLSEPEPEPTTKPTKPSAPHG